MTIAYLLGLFFLKIKLKSDLFKILFLCQKISFLASLRKYVPIMEKSFFLMISIIVRVFSKKLLVSQLLNKTRLLRGSTNIFSMCVVLFFFQKKYQTFSGLIRLNWLFILLIGYPLLFSIIDLLMNWFILLSPIFLI